MPAGSSPDLIDMIINYDKYQEEPQDPNTVGFWGLPTRERTARAEAPAETPPPDLYDMIENPEKYDPETGRPAQDVNPELLRSMRPDAAASSGALEKTPDEALGAPKTSADADIVSNALKGTADTDERTFDLDMIAKKYGNPKGGGYTGPDTGSIFTEKEISEKDSKGLIKKGYVENAEGKRVYIYAREPVKEKEGGTDTASNPREAAYNAIVKQAEKYHGIEDLRKFNPVAETNKAMDKLTARQFAWTFGGNTRPEDLTPEQQRHWEGVLKELYARTYNEIATKAQLARADVEKLMGMYEKNKDKFATAKSGDTIWDKNTGKVVSQVGGGKTSRLPEGVAKDVEGSVASFFKPVASQGMEGMEIKTEDVINKLDTNNKALYNELRRDAYGLLRKNPELSAFEAVDEAIKAKGWWTEADTDEAKTMKVWRPPQGTKGSTKAATPPKGFTPAPGKFKNGKQVYVSPDGKKGWVAP
jgi:hypothetical protein